MRRLLVTAMAAALLAGGWGGIPAEAQTETAAVVTLAPYATIDDVVGAIGRLTNNPALPQMVEGMIEEVTLGHGLAGIDRQRPMGMLVLVGPDGEGLVGYVPIVDMAAFTRMLAAVSGGEVDFVDGVHELDDGQRTIVLRERDGWAAISDRRDLLAVAPADPMLEFGDLPAQYVLAARGVVASLPAETREQVMGMLTMGVQAGLQPMPGETEEQFALRQQMALQNVEQIETLIDETETMTAGLAFDATVNSLRVDVELIARAGTDLAAQSTAMGEVTTAFAAFENPDAALFSVLMAQPLTEADQESSKQWLAAMQGQVAIELGKELSEAQRARAEAILASLVQEMNETIDTGKTDLAGSFLAENRQLVGIAAASVADGTRLEEAVKELIDLSVEVTPEIGPMVELDADTHEGVTLHLIRIPLDDPDMAPLGAVLGDPLPVVVGFGPQAVYLGVGAGAQDRLKAAITAAASEPTEPAFPGRVVVSTGRIVHTVVDTVEDPSVKFMLGGLSALLAQAEGRDRILMTQEAIPRGFRYRLEVEQGVVQLIAAAAEMAGALFGGADFGPDF